MEADSVIQAKKNLRRWREDPVSFVRECLGAEPDPWQAEILKAFTENQRLAMKACKGPGKTTILSWLCWNFLATRPYPKIAATSITADNLSDGLWAEMAKWQNNSKFLKAGFQWTKTRIVAKDHHENWFMSARTWSKSATNEQQANTLAGLHADYIMFVIDESGGIPQAVMAAAEAALSTGVECKLVQAGNPTHLEGPLYNACTSQAHLWYVVEITGDPDDPMRAPRISKQWAREQIQQYGRDNPWVMVNVFGKFPPGSLNSLIGPDEVRAAMGKHLPKDRYDWAQKRLGVDVARFGDDKTIIFPRQGLAAFKPVEMRAARSNDIAARVAMAKSTWGSDMEYVDGTGGYGAGVIDYLMQAGFSPQEINFAGKSSDDRYYNKRAEMWFNMVEWIKRGGAIPNDPELLKELTAPTYTFNKGKFQLEKKEQIKSRLGYSPDKADALALTFAQPEMASPTSIQGMVEQRRGRLKSDWDPLDDAR